MFLSSLDDLAFGQRTLRCGHLERSAATFRKPPVTLRMISWLKPALLTEAYSFFLDGNPKF